MPLNFRDTLSGVTSISRNTIHQHHALLAVDFLQAHFYNFGVAGLNRLADECWLPREVPDARGRSEHTIVSLRPPQVEKSVHRCADGPPRVKNIVNNHQIAIVHTETRYRSIAPPGAAPTVERSSRYSVMSSVPTGTSTRSKTLNRFRQPLRERERPPAHPNKGQVFSVRRFFRRFRGRLFAACGRFLRRKEVVFFLRRAFRADSS